MQSETTIKTEWTGAKPVSSAIVLTVGIILWFLPHSSDIDPKGWHLLAVFIATILGIAIRPLPMGAVAIIGFTVVTMTGTLEVAEAFSAFGNDLIWLIVAACFIARGFLKTGLGRRIAYIFLYLFGRSPLGIAYGFYVSELMLAPAIPSSTARAGGVQAPILKSLLHALGSKAETGTARKLGEFLTLTTFHGTIITTTMFLTASGANPVILQLAGASGIEITWWLWAKAAIVPALVSLGVIPLVIYALYPPEQKNTTYASTHAKEKLAEMGRLTLHESWMLFTFALLLVLWIFGKEFGVNATVAALIGVSFLMITGVLTWKELLAEEVAWDSLVWFAILVMMAFNLNTYGVIDWFSDQIVGQVEGIAWHYAFVILLALYFLMHYFFASVTAHVSSMYAAFLTVAIGVGTPALYAALAFGFFSTLCGGITHYGIGQAPVFYAMHYVDVRRWWICGFVLSVIYFVIWITIGSYWWKWLGIW